MTETLTLTTQQVELINWALVQTYKKGDTPEMQKAIFSLVGDIADQRIEAKESVA